MDDGRPEIERMQRKGTLLVTATDQLAEFVAATRLADIPADVVARGRLVLADCIGCMVAGAVVAGDAASGGPPYRPRQSRGHRT